MPLFGQRHGKEKPETKEGENPLMNAAPSPEGSEVVAKNARKDSNFKS